MGENNRSIRNYYLARLKEYRKAGYSDHDAAVAAEKDTRAKYGRMPD